MKAVPVGNAHAWACAAERGRYRLRRLRSSGPPCGGLDQKIDVKVQCRGQGSKGQTGVESCHPKAAAKGEAHAEFGVNAEKTTRTRPQSRLTATRM